MFPNIPIRLQVLTEKDFVLFISVLNGLTVLSALLSNYPVPLTILAVLFCGAMWIFYTLRFTKANYLDLTSVIFADGRVRLESGQEEITEGFLCGQQWCTRWLAVLRFSDGESTRKLLVRSSPHCDGGDFRRLNMWLRHYSYDSPRQNRVLDV